MAKPSVGTVKWFDSRETKQFGFIKVDGTDDEVFFHLNDGKYLEVGNDVVVWETPTARHLGTDKFPYPKRDDRIVFDYSRGAQGRFKAMPWAYEQAYLVAQEELARRAQERENRPVYRALETMNSLGSKPPEPKVLWQGKDIQEALRRFPVPSGRRSPSADPLLPYWADNDNIFEVRHWWEVQQPDGSWQQCNDPRPLTGVLRQFERISRR